MDRPLRVLVVEDSEADFLQIRRCLNPGDMLAACCRVASLEELNAAIDSDQWDVVLADYVVPGLDFLDGLHLIQARLPDVPVILISAAIGEEKAVELIKSGVSDFVPKDDVRRLSRAIAGALRESAQRREAEAAEEALCRSEERYRSLFQTATDALFVFSLGPDGQPGRFTEVNDVSCEMLGYEREELLRLSPSDITDPTVIDRLPTIFQELLRNKRQHTETRLMAKDGRSIPVEISGSLFHVRSQPTVLGIIKDITGKKRTEEKLRQAIADTLLQHQKRARRDVGVIATLCVLVLLASSQFDVFEHLSFWLLKHRATSVDEVFTTLVFLAFALVVYALRRKRDFRLEVAGRNQAEDALRELQGELELRVQARTKALCQANDGLQVAIGEHAMTLAGLRHQEAELRESQRIAGIGSWEWTIATGEIVWSDGLNHLLGRDCGLPAPTFEALPQFFTPESWEWLRAAIAKTIETGAPYELELEQIRADGTTCWATTRGEAVRGADGTVVKLHGTIHDINERKRSDEALRLQSAALHAAASAIVITDRQGTIQWINPAFEALTGYTADEAVGKNPRALQKSGVHDQVLYKDLWNTILGGHVWRGEMTNRRKDGSLYPEDMVVTPVKDARGAVTHFIAIKRDLTKEREAEAKFLQSQKMEIVGRLAGGIAHDFNNLLTVINGTAELASTDLPEGGPLRADLEEIHRAGVRATSLTRQLLAFSRQQVMHVEVLNLHHEIAGLRSMLQRVIGEDITLVVAAATDEGSVKADAGQLEQVVMNLVVNARDAMPNGGVLTITTENVELDQAQAAAVSCECLRPGPYVCLAVRDTGTGMDEVTRGRIFEPFFTTKEQGKGTGLGLATVFGIVTQSSGGISVDSKLGRGSTFTVYLPRMVDVPAAREPAVTAPAAAATGTILVVEDEDGVRHLAQRMLQSLGYTVLTARSAADALSILGHHEGPVHLMLTDVVMPTMSGPELAKRVATIRPDMKIMFSSGHTDNAALRADVLGDHAHFVGKPYTRTDLMRKVREALEAEPEARGAAGVAATAIAARLSA